MQANSLNVMCARIHLLVHHEQLFLNHIHDEANSIANRMVLKCFLRWTFIYLIKQIIVSGWLSEKR